MFISVGTRIFLKMMCFFWRKRDKSVHDFLDKLPNEESRDFMHRVFEDDVTARIPRCRGVALGIKTLSPYCPFASAALTAVHVGLRSYQSCLSVLKSKFILCLVTKCNEYRQEMEVKKLHEFMELVGRLKHMKRTGWVLRDVAEPETIAGHIYRMAMLSFLVDGSENLDKTRIMQMALIHDLAECIVGDITPHCGVSAEDKHRREDKAMEEICELLGDQGLPILNLFREYESQESAEAKYVKDLDRLDLIMQAFEYEKRDNTPGKLEEFFSSTNGKILHPFINKMADEINEQRRALIQALPDTKA